MPKWMSGSSCRCTQVNLCRRDTPGALFTRFCLSLSSGPRDHWKCTFLGRDPKTRSGVQTLGPRTLHFMSALADMQASDCQAGVVVGVILVHSPRGGCGSGHCRCSAGVLASCSQPIAAPARCLRGLRGEALGLWGG